MKALANAVEAILGVAMLILIPPVLLVFWNHLSGSAFLQSCESAPSPVPFRRPTPSGPILEKKPYSSISTQSFRP
jgi:hypothetical protein